MLQRHGLPNHSFLTGLLPHRTRRYFHCLLLSNGSDHHRDLHSFPTRRSSDLGAGAKCRRLDRAAPGFWLPNLEDRSLGARQPNSDRKSTRLNSSHLGISYAVFCLKKKTKLREEEE